MLTKDRNAKDLSDSFRGDLVDKITDKAQGVFLWAWFTVRLLLDSIGRRDSPGALMKRLEGVPQAPDELYERLLGLLPRQTADGATRCSC